MGQEKKIKQTFDWKRFRFPFCSHFIFDIIAWH